MSTTAPASGDNCCHMHKDNAGTARTMSGLFHFLYYGGKIRIWPRMFEEKAESFPQAVLLNWANKEARLTMGFFRALLGID